jgi:crotonobetainyl-CoA:carnitine CoA-transferase CaiB-like acyl-CoA transferase
VVDFLASCRPARRDDARDLGADDQVAPPRHYARQPLWTHRLRCYHHAVNRNKRLDRPRLKTEGDPELRTAGERADVVVSNFLPGTLDASSSAADRSRR